MQIFEKKERLIKVARQQRVLVIGATQRDSGAVAAAFIAPPPACTAAAHQKEILHCLRGRVGGANNYGAPGCTSYPKCFIRRFGFNAAQSTPTASRRD